MISIIAGIGKNNELGKNNALLWRLPADLKHFKELTSGHSIVMGRKTFESIGKILPNRRNIIITRDKNYKIENAEIAHSLEEALRLASLAQGKHLNEEVFIIGGAEIYKQAMNFADKLYITEINATDKKADVFFPEIIPIVFGEVSRENHQKDEKNPYDYAFVEYKRFF
ncbi:dihydrofolate reductase [Candidatus Nomurabacteria bacterium]|nr:dihydrofolate reductase [Candidatus Nomurabacteria bacterium]